jgi:aminodeoxychorismate lyase
MIVFLNGKFVPESRAVVSVFDRGFLYGDALFEAVLITKGRPFMWDEHIRRLQRGVAFLQLTVSFSYPALRRHAMELIRRNRMPDSILRLSITRGITARGYSPKNATKPTVVMSLHPAPVIKEMPRWRVVTASFRLTANDPLSDFKTANKLIQVLARAEADEAGAQEAILLNTDGFPAEGTTSNLFWIKGETIFTPPLRAGALPGVTRAAVLELCVKMNIKFKERNAKPRELLQADGAFLTMTSMGLVEIESLDGQPLKRSPLAGKLWTEYRNLLGA